MIRLMFLILFAFSMTTSHAFLPIMAFWQRSVSPVFATINSLGLGPTPSNNLAARSVTIGGPGILSYKAVVINSGTCQSPGVAALLNAEPETSVAIQFSFTPPPMTTDDYFTVCAIGKNFVGAWQSDVLPTSSMTLRVNTIKPVMQSLSLNNGTTTTIRNVVPVAFHATHANLNVSHFCLKSQIGLAIPATPSLVDACWKVIDGVNPPVPPSTNVSFTGYNYNIGYTQETYHVFAWARSASGAISDLVSGTGSLGTDLFSIDYFPPSPPTIINVLSVNSDTPNNPPTQPDLVVPAGTTVYVKWKATDDSPLPGAAITISYTTDETNFTTIVSGLANTQGAGCTLAGGDYTGCYTWTNGSPMSSYYKVRVAVVDSTGLESFSSSPPNNTTPFSIIAGNTDLGLNGSAASAIFQTFNSNGLNTGPSRFVVRDDGQVFVLDNRGLMTINPFDGLYKMFIPYGGQVDGPRVSASLYSPNKMVLDASDNLLIFDYNKIRKYDFATGQLTTIVGGGNSTANGVSALNLQINPTGSNDYMLFTVLPNGNIWFQTGDDFMRARNAGAKVRYYNAADQKVYIITPSGNGSLEDAGFNPDTYAIYNFGILFDGATSNVLKIRSRSIIPVTGGHIPRSVSYSPVHGGVDAPHIPFIGYWTEDSTVNSINGDMYNVDHFQLNGVHKYDPNTNSWVRLLGTGTKGQCVDGTPALSCNADPNDVYVSATGQVYFMDRNRIRVIDSSGNVQTIFGQSLSFGHNELATSARLNSVIWIGRADDGRLIVKDNNEALIREFTLGGNMINIAGNGTEAGADTTANANAQSIVPGGWYGTLPMSVDPVTGDVWYTRDGGGLISKLDRSTGKWVDVVGGGGTIYWDADGLLGNQNALGGYVSGPVGLSPTQVIRGFYAWDGTQAYMSFIKLFDKTDGTQTHLAGLSGVNLDSFDNCTVGTPVANCRVPTQDAYSRMQWDAGNSQWLIHHPGSNIINVAAPGGNLGRYSMPRGMDYFHYQMRSGVPFMYYCSGGRMYKYNLNTSSEIAMFWPTPTVNCSGRSMVFDPVRESIIFPIYQNGISAIAEILDP